MARNRANLTMRFPDAVTTWTQAIDNNGLVLRFNAQAEAIAANFRLQRFRKAYRETLADGELSVYDRFRVKVPPGQATIIIEPTPQMAPSSVTRLDGEPLDGEVPLQLEEC